MEARKGVDHSRELGHRWGSNRETIKMMLHALIEVSVGSTDAAKASQCLFVRKLAEDDEHGDFQEIGPGTVEFFDGDAAIAQYALFAVDESDGTLAGARVAVAWIIGDETCLGAQRGDIDRQLTLGAFNDWKFQDRPIDC
jgi:hypothetical protein